MPESIQCPSCRASNPPEASWCSLCFTPFGSDEPDGDQVATATVPEPARREGDLAAPISPPPPPPAEGEQLAFLEPGNETKTWSCRFCETRVPVGQVQCPTCQQTIYDSFGGQPPEVDLDPVEALRRSMLPGGGHFALQQGITATTILALTVISIGMGLYLLISGVFAYGALLIVIGLTLWLLAAHDAFRMASGHPEEVLLRPRVLSIIMGAWFIIVIGAVRSAQQVINQ